MDRSTLRTPEVRVILTAMAAETSIVGWLAGVALSDPGELSEAEVAALADAIGERGYAQPDHGRDVTSG